MIWSLVRRHLEKKNRNGKNWLKPVAVLSIKIRFFSFQGKALALEPRPNVTFWEMVQQLCFCPVAWRDHQQAFLAQERENISDILVSHSLRIVRIETNRIVCALVDTNIDRARRKRHSIHCYDVSSLKRKPKEQKTKKKNSFHGYSCRHSLRQSISSYCNPGNFRKRLIFVLFVNSWNLWRLIAY